MGADAVETKGKFNIKLIVQIALICMLFVFIIFGVTCVVSKFISSTSGQISIFGYNVVDITDDLNEPDLQQGRQVVVSRNFNLNVGDYVLYVNNGVIDFSSDYIAKIIEIDNSKVVLQKNKDNSNLTLSQNHIFAKIFSTSAITSGFVGFLLSGFPLWVFVIIPCLCLISLIILYFFRNLKQNNANSKNSENISSEIKKEELEPTDDLQKLDADKLENDNVEDVDIGQDEKIDEADKDLKVEEPLEESVEQQKPIPKEKTKSKKEKKERKEKKEQKSIEVEEIPILEDIKKFEQNQIEKEIKKVQEEKPRLYMHSKPKNDKRDDYIFIKQPFEKSNVHFHNILKKFNIESTHNQNKNSSELLNKMRNEAIKSNGDKK